MADATRTRSDAPEVEAEAAEESGFTWDLDVLRDHLDRAPEMVDLAACVEALNERREALARQVARLEAQVAQMSTEVRTRRLVVVDETGYERIMAETHKASAELRVQTRPERSDDPVCSVALGAGEESVESDAGVYLNRWDLPGGDRLGSTGRFEVQADDAIVLELQYGEVADDEPGGRGSTVLLSPGEPTTLDQRVESLEGELERLRAALAMMGHLADHATRRNA